MPEHHEAQGVVEAVLPRSLFRVRLADGAAITASLATQARRVTVKVLPGDRVTVEVYPYDPTKGRITERLK